MIKNQQAILDKLKIAKLNPMQEAAGEAIYSRADVVLLSPTGTGKTLAFLLPLLSKLDAASTEIQALILVPSRELALQIEQVIREMGAGIKVNAFYGGRSGSKDKMDLNHKPAILIGTPGRISDHLRRERFPTHEIKTLILDEYDKSLEVGFESEMKDIVGALHQINQRILTSATRASAYPAFLGMKKPQVIDYLEAVKSKQLTVMKVVSPSRDKRDILVELLSHIGNQPGIIFCNLKDTIQEVSNHLHQKGIAHGCFSGDMEQRDRERTLIKFRNGTHQLLVATDLAARGLDITDLHFIIHYELPLHTNEFTHRNGRTARMHQEGTAYLLQGAKERLPEFVGDVKELKLKPAKLPDPAVWKTLFISGGRKDKISKGDIAGIFFKQGGLGKTELGIIEIKQDCAFVAVHTAKADSLVQKLDNTRIKKKKVRITQI